MKWLLLIACVASIWALILSLSNRPSAQAYRMIRFDAGNGVFVQFGGGVVSVVDGNEHIYTTRDSQWTTSPLTKDGRAFSVRVADGYASFQIDGDPDLKSVRARRP